MMSDIIGVIIGIGLATYIFDGSLAIAFAIFIGYTAACFNIYIFTPFTNRLFKKYIDSEPNL